VEGKILAIKYAREHKIPYLGLCYGMQLATIEFARHVAGLKDANTTENDAKTPHPVIHIMPEQEKLLEGAQYGGTMRLGAYDCKLTPDTTSFRAYTDSGQLTTDNSVSERHRHRYEFNNKYRETLEKKGLVIAGTSPNNSLVEIIEIKNHPFFVATQFHPEFKSRPLRPHPLFLEFIKASLKK
jgi:CTP synthase